MVSGLEQKTSWFGKVREALWNPEMSERREEGLGEMGRKVSPGERRAALSWEWSQVASSVSDTHVDTRSTEEGGIKSQRTFVSSRKAEGG